MKNKKVLLIVRFSVQNFKVSVELWKSYIVHSRLKFQFFYKIYFFQNFVLLNVTGTMKFHAKENGMKTGQNKLHLISAFLIKQGNVIMSVQCHVSKMRKNVLAKWILLLDVLRQIFAGLKMRIVRPIHTIQNGVDNFCKIQNCTKFFNFYLL